ncbi:MAG: PilT/PilU family type 4a pilus ATPase [Neisseria sp.]|nr:PilT/PilU family type 4a pilus ATPase [Neisseria sp.]
MFKLMEYAAEHNASDIFIAPDFPPAVKINGKITPLSDKPYAPATTRDLVYSTMNEKQIREFESEWELNYAHRATDEVRFRVNAYHEQGRVGMVMRKINTEIATLDDLKLPEVLKRLAMAHRGLIIVVGATGSGKSTSLAAMVDYRNKRAAGHIVTIEDPIEFVHRHHKSIITQREIGIDTESWHVALKSAMRQAPDVVIVGEVRDEDSMSHALQLSQTGHLCMCTLHATNANQAIERVINFYNEDRHPQIFMDLAMNLVAIVSQRLVVKADGSGRTVAMDIMLNTPAVQDLIFKGDIDGIKEIMTRSEDDGMQTFDQHLFELYKEGVIDFDEAMRNADSANNLRLAIKLYEEGLSPDERNKRVQHLDLM